MYIQSYFEAIYILQNVMAIFILWGIEITIVTQSLCNTKKCIDHQEMVLYDELNMASRAL